MARETVCENDNCGNVARWRPIIVWHDADGNVLLEGDTHLSICNDCRGVATIDAFMDDAQYRRLCATYRALGRPTPKREHLEIQLKPL